MRQIIKFLKESRAELDRIEWPSREETLRMTTIVIAVSIILGIYIGATDFALTKVIEFFIK